MSEHFAVRGGASLAGAVDVVGAKNSVLKLMAAALLTEGTTTITNCPQILDVPLMADVLRSVGCEVFVDADTVYITTPAVLSHRADSPAMSKLRASVGVLGPLVGRLNRAVVALPGGDAIGSRPLDMHQNGLRQLGATSTIEHGCVVASAERLTGSQIWLDFPSVGATENLLMAAALAEGTTVIDNAAREPEISDVVAMLTRMGANIEGAGTSTLVVHGVSELYPTEHRVLGDRIVGATWAFAAAMTQGDVSVYGVDPRHLDLVLEKLRFTGANVTTFGGSAAQQGFRVKQTERPKSVDFVTLPYPGFATDLQPFAVALSAVCSGTSMITENVYEARFRFIEEMMRLGADARTDGHHAVVRGVERLSSAPVWASDIRAGAGLVLAGLCADGVTEVYDVAHIDRGYPDFVANMTRLGAHVDRIKTDPTD